MKQALMLAALAAMPVGAEQDRGNKAASKLEARVEIAITQGVRYLKGQAGTLKVSAHGGRPIPVDELVLWTFIHAGLPESDADFQRLFKNMTDRRLEWTYSVSLQAMILEELDRVKHQPRIYQCAQFLVDNQARNGQWDYGQPVEAAPEPPEGSRAVATSRRVENPYTQTTQFYSTGNSILSLPPGSYTLKVFKGIEYRVQAREVRVEVGKTAELEVSMARWANMPEQGWYSADGHLHIARPCPDLNPILSKWMQAEDLHVANLLQFGIAKRFHNAIQYDHGPGAVYREGDTLLVSGQENPRTDFRGHAIILGAKSPIHFPDQYLIYTRFFEEARRQGALSGYAHFGTFLDGQTGLALDLPHNLLDFLEVMTFQDAHYENWYDVLNTGYRLAPTAGTDYPCVPSIPGRERFYTQVEAPFSHESWLEGIRRGRTFVTNGPLLEFRLDGKGLGEEIVLKKPRRLVVEGRVRFDPARDAVERLELVQGGYVLRSFPREGTSSEIACRFEVEGGEACWLALRAWGSKRGETSPSSNGPPYRDRTWARSSIAHTAPIYVVLEGAPGLAAHSRAKGPAGAWLARLENLERRLAEDQIPHLVQGTVCQGDDGIDADYLRKNRAALLDAIQAARKRFEAQAK